MSAQIQSLKQSLGMGMGMQGTAKSGWGLGTSPYAVNPAPADGANQVEERQGEGTGNTETTQFESLYAPEDNAHAFGEEAQLHGRMDLTQSPKKTEEVRSAPETQEALTAYANIVGAYAEGEESAIEQEQVPLEYQEMVRKYFDQVKKDAEKEGGEKEKEKETSSK